MFLMTTQPDLASLWLVLVAATTVHAAGAPAQHASRTINTDEPFVTLRGATKATIAPGGNVDHLDLYDTAEVTINAGAVVAHATAHDAARIKIRGKVSVLTLLDGSSGVLDNATIDGDGYSGVTRVPVQIMLSPRSQLHLHATDVSFHGYAVHGFWKSGERFSIAVGLNDGSEEKPIYKDAETLPTQISIVAVAAPGFDCRAARSPVERMICANDDLAEADLAVSNLFSYAIAQAPDQERGQMRNAQRAWLRQRNACAAIACVQQQYEVRMQDLMVHTGKFTVGYSRALCTKLLEPRTRTQLLENSIGTDDINNDGTAERSETCWGGTMNAPCTSYFANDKELEIKTQGFESNDYWTFGERAFRYDGKTFVYHSFDDGLEEPAYVSYVTAANREFVVCDFDNRFSSSRLSGDAAVCQAIEREQGVEDITLPAAPANTPHPAFGRRHTDVRKLGNIDVDNDGITETIAELEYSVGAGRGCDFNYFELTTPDGSGIAGTVKSRLVDDLQDIGYDGFEGPSCVSVQNRLIRHEGTVYFETNSTNQAGVKHTVARLQQGQVTQVCSFGRVVTSTIRSVW